jgi:hypothetical protein
MGFVFGGPTGAALAVGANFVLLFEHVSRFVECGALRPVQKSGAAFAAQFEKPILGNFPRRGERLSV